MNTVINIMASLVFIGVALFVIYVSIKSLESILNAFVEFFIRKDE